MTFPFKDLFASTADRSVEKEPKAYQLVGRVVAYQGYDE